MKITKRQLRRIIKEEKAKILEAEKKPAFVKNKRVFGHGDPNYVPISLRPQPPGTARSKRRIFKKADDGGEFYRMLKSTMKGYLAETGRTEGRDKLDKEDIKQLKEAMDEALQRIIKEFS